ncbi:Mesothelin-like protein [Acipenser ruthenus]|uniref:Mesothelin-like protein n=1 Tax=Acipenser ruthenus TaxID=7906 RepID=A0A444TYL7_ACIRT|nr:Mesothelin-like protein [Acipenser ruthenus]
MGYHSHSACILVAVTIVIGFPCVNSTISTKDWMGRNLGRFSSIATFGDLRLLNRNFAMSAAIITKYLGAGKTLDAVALKAIGGENLCSLSVSQLKNITAPNLRDAGALDISSCTPEKKKELYNTASAALISQRSDVLTYYNLIKPYLGEFHCSSL